MNVFPSDAYGYTLAAMPEQRRRSANLMLRLSDEERHLLVELAKADGLSMADVLRQSIRRQARGHGIAAPSPQREAKRPRRRRS